MKNTLKLLSFAFLAAVLAIGFAVNCKKQAPSGDQPATQAGSDVEKGKELYINNGCSGCHGEGGLGDGPAGKALKPPPRDLTVKASYKQGATEEAVAKTIETGVPKTTMGPYATIPQNERLLIAKYIVSLQK